MAHPDTPKGSFRMSARSEHRTRVENPAQEWALPRVVVPAGFGSMCERPYLWCQSTQSGRALRRIDTKRYMERTGGLIISFEFLKCP